MTPWSGDPANYLPSEALVSSVVGVGSADAIGADSRRNLVDECLDEKLFDEITTGAEPTARNGEELRHLIGCVGCQAEYEGAVIGRTEGEQTFLPSEILVRRVMRGVWRRRPRFRFPDSLVGEVENAPYQPSLRRRAATVVLALGLSPTVLAAVVVLHVAAFTGAGVWAVSHTWNPSSLRQTATATEHVQIVHLDAGSIRPTVAMPTPSGRAGVSTARAADSAYQALRRRALAAAVSQQIFGFPSGDMVRGAFTATEDLKLRETARVLRKFPSVAIRVEFDSTVLSSRAPLSRNSARARASTVKEFLTRNGAIPTQIRVVPVDVASVCVQRVEPCAADRTSILVSLDSIGNMRRP